ncbi:3'-5' exonuclease [Leptospira alstonii]|uniref:Exonuclease n=2 Tax=Leptospira alstonii TaxID=28452 RepID=M6CY31_9LEPT|nr:3'-5' exonuclease [Leptospira alstonii]EMJ91185.1 exonuclease [Leptospira alstonii serovar Sichuan str. 79601]EQA81547.1 exonuclease [Leptospira alstonii serovar Pingchang str. 80-412]
MNLLGIDFETNGTDPYKSEIIEFGAVLWDSTKIKPLCIESNFISPNSTHFEIEEDVKNLTGIEEKDLYSYGISIEPAARRIFDLLSKATCIVSHFGIDFDRIILERMISIISAKLPKLLWIDTGYDVNYPKKIRTRKLDYLSFEHGLIPYQSHRALFDVFTMLNILSKYDINDVVKTARTPLLKVKAKVDYESKELALKNGFHWNKERKLWEKEIREETLKKEKYPFEIEREIIFQSHK